MVQVKIEAAEEEAATLQLNQEYNQDVAKNDKLDIYNIITIGYGNKKNQNSLNGNLLLF